MYVKLRTQRSSPSRLNGVAPKNRIGTSLVRKKWRTSEMFFSRRRGCVEPAAKAASVPMLTSRGSAALAGAGVVARLAGVDLLAGVFFAGVFLAGAFLTPVEDRLARTGRSPLIALPRW